MTHDTADISEFEAQRNKLPGDRRDIAAVGHYVLELYTDPLGQRPRSVVEVNTRDTDSDGNPEYSKVDSVWFNPDEHDDPEQAAEHAFGEMRQSEAAVEARLS